MSWTCQIPTVHADEAEDAILDAPVAGQDINSTHVYKAAKAAKECAMHILTQGAVGGPDKQFAISLGGHANTGHEPAPEWCNDTITVSVRQL